MKIPFAQKLKNLPPKARYAILISAALFILTNLYHWTRVWKYPLFYYFPSHSFRVVDADTGQPLEGVAAVYIYEMKSVYRGGEASHYATPVLDPWVCFYAPSDWSGTVRVGLREGVSDRNGVITMPSFGPVRRRRNHAFQQTVPEMYLFKSSYEVKKAFSFRDESEYWHYILRPHWGTEPIKLKLLIDKQKENSSQTKRAGKYYKQLFRAMSSIYRGDENVWKQYRYYDKHLGKSIRLFSDELNRIQSSLPETYHYEYLNWSNKFKRIKGEMR